MLPFLTLSMLCTVVLPLTAHSSPPLSPSTPNQAESISMGVAQLFMALPRSALPSRIGDPAVVLQTDRADERRALQLGLDYWVRHDPAAGTIQIRSIGDGEGWSQQYSAHTLPAGTSVLLSVSTNWGMCGAQSTVSVWQFGPEGAVDATVALWPVPSWTDFNRGTVTAEKHQRPPGYSVTLRETGRRWVTLDGCQFEYPGPLGPLAFDPALDGLTSQLEVKWDHERFVLHAAPAPGPK